MVAFAFGAFFIITDIGLPWLPAAAVVVYGALLLYAATRLQVVHSEATNNSPYFLGFLLFLTSLFSAFYLKVVDGNIQLNTLIRELGAALLTTIAGLPFRQMLFACNPIQDDQDTFFRSLEEQLRRSASEFRRSQVEMVDMIREFVATRRQLLESEEGAIKQYVANLSEATALLDSSIKSYPTAISATLESCKARFADLEERIRALGEAAQSVDASALKSSLESFPTISASVKGLDESLSALQVSLAAVRRTSEAMPSALQGQLAETRERIAAIPTSTNEHIALLQEDLISIDSILQTFVKLLQERIEAVGR
jgi:hypothetical protein